MVQEIYKQNPELYDNLHDEKDYQGEAAFVAELYPNPMSEANVLDIGCGTGRHHPHFARHGCDGLGVDANDAVLEVARDRCESFDYVQAEMPRLAAESIESAAPFDLIVLLYDVINYLPPDALRPTFERVKELLHSNGTVIFDNAVLPDDGRDPTITTTQTDDGEYVRLGKLEPTDDRRFEWKAAVITNDSDGGFDFFTDEQTYTGFRNDEITELLGELGFRVTTHDGYGTGTRTDEFLTVFTARRE